MLLFNLVSNLIFIKLIHFIRQLQTLTECHACMHSSTPKTHEGKLHIYIQYSHLISYKVSFNKLKLHYQMSVVGMEILSF